MAIVARISAARLFVHQRVVPLLLYGTVAGFFLLPDNVALNKAYYLLVAPLTLFALGTADYTRLWRHTTLRWIVGLHRVHDIERRVDLRRTGGTPAGTAIVRYIDTDLRPFDLRLRSELVRQTPCVVRKHHSTPRLRDFGCLVHGSRHCGTVSSDRSSRPSVGTRVGLCVDRGNVFGALYAASRREAFALSAQRRCMRRRDSTHRSPGPAAGIRGRRPARCCISTQCTRGKTRRCPVDRLFGHSCCSNPR